jgi:hypothetical protein
MFAAGGVAPELAYVTAKFAALIPLARVEDLFAELLPVGGAANAGPGSALQMSHDLNPMRSLAP